MDNYSYADIALEDLQASKALLALQMYNHSARLCQQYVEKIFKEIIFRLGSEEKDMFALHHHNVYKLSSRVAELTNTKFSKDDIGFFRSLTDYYFDTNYPGENYVRIQKEEADEVYASTLLFAGKMQPLLSQLTSEADSKYAHHKVFIEKELAQQVEEAN